VVSILRMNQTLAHIVKTLASSHLGIVLDTVNSFGSLEPPELVVETLVPYTVNLHIKDFEVKRVPHNLGFEVWGVDSNARVTILKKYIYKPGAGFTLTRTSPLSSYTSTSATKISCESDSPVSSAP
jgi:3-oxoisoapionate decarboxylase